MHGTTRLSRAIERVTDSQTHHVVVGLGNGLVASAEPFRGVVIRPETDYPELVWSDFKFTDEQRTIVVDFAVCAVGAPYNYAAFVLMGMFGEAGLRVPQRLASLLSGSKRFDCSQLAVEALQQATSPLFPHPSWMITPGDLQMMYSLRGWSLDGTPTTKDALAQTDHL